MELIDEIMVHITDYCKDPEAVSNALYVCLSNYSVTKKSTELTKYIPDTNDLLIKKFLVVKKIKGCTPRTLKFYGDEVTKILARIGKNVIDISTDDIRIYIAMRIREGISAVTVANEKRVLSSFLTYCHNEDIIRKNPILPISTMKQRKTKKNAFKDEELILMRDQLRTSRERAIFELLLSTGCRVSELVGIRLDDMQPDGSIIVHGKGQKDRYVYLNAAARIAYEKYMADRKDNSLWLFPRCVPVKFCKGVSRKDIKYWYTRPEMVIEDECSNAGTIEAIVREIGKRCGVKAHPHKFRRTCATMALKNGMPVEMVSKMLGHDNIGTTQIYLDINDDDMAAMHKRYVR